MKFFWPRAACAITALLLLVTAYYSYASYFSRYYFVLAKRGQKSEEQYEALLQKSLAFDPSYGYANLERARLLIFQKKYGLAYALQQRGMESFRPVRAYEQMGTVQVRLGRIEEAKGYFAQTVRMNPHNVLALEQLAYIAMQQQDSERLDTLVREILRLDLGNLNAYYLRGRDAEQLGEDAAALRSYERVSAELSRKPQRSGRLLFQRQEIESRLRHLREVQLSR